MRIHIAGTASTLAMVSVSMFWLVPRATTQEITERAIQRFKYNAVRCVALSRDGKLLAVAGFKGVMLWDSAKNMELRVLATAGVFDKVYFASDDKRVVAAGTAQRGEKRIGEIKVWDVETGTLRQAISWPDSLPISGFAVAPSGKTVFAADGITAKQWDLDSGKEIRRLKPKSGGISYVVFSPKAELVVTVGGDGRWGTVWDTRRGDQVAALTVKGEGGGEPVFSPDGKQLATVVTTIGRNTRMTFWDTEAWKEIPNTPEFPEVRKFVFSPDGKVLAALGFDTTVRLWDVTSGKELSSLAVFEAPGDTKTLAFAPGGKILAVGGHEIRDQQYHGFYRLLDISVPKKRR